MRKAVVGMLKDHFRPEFLNRIDETIVFQALGTKELGQIVGLQLEAVAARLAERKIARTKREPPSILLC
jgi:ATP-dependent Clp protease ATP-binding subunit ClpB